MGTFDKVGEYSRVYFDVNRSQFLSGKSTFLIIRKKKMEKFYRIIYQYCLYREIFLVSDKIRRVSSSLYHTCIWTIVWKSNWRFFDRVRWLMWFRQYLLLSLTIILFVPHLNIIKIWQLVLHFIPSNYLLVLMICFCLQFFIVKL